MASTQELPINISTQLPCEWGGASGLGPRKENQDVAALVPKDDPRIRERGIALVVCDGVGGEVGGQTAARIAAQTTLECYYNGVPTEASESADKTVIPISDDGDDDTTSALEAAIHHANHKVKAEALNIAENAHMATTVVAAIVRNGQLYTTHVGDSRAYLFHANGNIERVTRDHSWVAEQVAAGVLTEEEARQSAMRVVVTRSLGSASNNTPESNKRILQAGDRLLLCSDGLYGTLNDAQMAEIMQANPNPSDAAKALVKAALPTTTDNTTAVVLNYGHVPKADKQQRASMLLVVGGLVLALLGIIALILWMQNRPKVNSNIGDNAQTAPAPVASQPPQPTQNNLIATIVNTPEAITPTQAATNSPGATSTLAPTLAATATVLAATQRPNATAAATAANKTPTPKPIATQPKPAANATASTTVTSTEAIIAATTTSDDANLLILRSVTTATPTKSPVATASASPIPATATRPALPLPKPPAPPARPAKPDGGISHN